jgi:hypothetical protein
MNAHLATNEKSLPIQWTELPTGTLVGAGYWEGFLTARGLMLWTIHQLEATGGQAASPEYSDLCIKWPLLFLTGDLKWGLFFEKLFYLLKNKLYVYLWGQGTNTKAKLKANEF